MQILRFLISTIFFAGCFVNANAQPGAEIEVKKPKKYENRKLASEKTGEKKFTVTRKLYQNTVTHYNYYFNANNRLNEVVNTAKSTFKDDFTQLLPFYNYTLDQTSQSKQDLDSVIYKCTAGILLHDLRNSWIDNMYLLLAKAYFFRNDLDSAGLTLQYLNFSFAPKEDGGYDKPIGSNASNQLGEFSIATKEKNSIWTKLTSRPPSRNESFIWQIRNHIEKNELPEASGVIEILRHDPNFPKRLNSDLNEVLAYWFYKQQVYDSAAMHLIKALDEAPSTMERARWEFLVGQMYQLSKHDEDAVNYYNKSIAHTTDPIMDVYARLNSIRINRSDRKDILQENINALIKMAGREKYFNYRDIIYFAAANIELERNNFAEARVDLLKSVKYSQNNPQQRSQSFLLLADIHYNRSNYTDAYNFYDSTDINVLNKNEDKERVTLRKPPLKIIAENTSTVLIQDSLQSLANLPAEQRDAIIKKQVRLLRKEQGLKDEDVQGSNTAVKQAPDLFASNNTTADFYFYNSASKARGFSEFKARWGERPNVDNWNRKSALDRQVQKIADVDDVPDKAASASQKASDNSYEGLQQNIPTTPEKLDISNNNIMDALFSNGITFMNKLEEYPAAILAFEDLLRRFPNTKYKDEALFNLAYAYEKTGNKTKSDQTKNQLATASPDSKFTKLLNHPAIDKMSDKELAATKKYEAIYDLFIEGQFNEAKNQKKVADSVYGKSFWTPQLLFIESIYYIKQREDSTAIRVLTDLTNLNSSSALAQRAKTMIDVLKRRKEIEDYLTKLEVTRNVDKPASTQVTTATKEEKPVTVVSPPVAKDSIITKSVANVKKELPLPPAINKDSLSVKPVIVKSATKNDTTSASTYKISKDTILDVSKSELSKKSANKKDSIAGAKILMAKKGKKTISTSAISKNDSTGNPELVINPALNTPTNTIKKDTTISSTASPVKQDSASLPAISYKNFNFVASDPHYVVVLLDKVDPVYASEARNAFNRFNSERYYNQKIEISGLKLSDQYNLVLEGPFTDANAAVEYIDKVKPLARSSILPWLKAEKFSFLIISKANLDLLKVSQDVDSYKLLIQKAVPGKF